MYYPRKPKYDNDSDFKTNANSYYKDLARKQYLIKKLSEKIWEYDKKLANSLNEIEDILNGFITIVNDKLEIINNLVNDGFNDRIEDLLIQWINDGTLNQIINEEIFNTKADKIYVDDNLDIINNRLNETVRVINYEMFGAVLDGITDDSTAIKEAHLYANEHGLSVVQRNSTFMLNEEIPVKTDVDLTGSKVITNWVDNSNNAYNRGNVLYRILGNDLEDITSNIIQPDFKKGVTTINSLANIESGTLIITTDSTDLVRYISGNRENVLKSEANLILKNNEGNLVYPLTKDYSTSSNFKVLLRKYEEKLVFKAPTFIMDNAKLYSLIFVRRNNTTIKNMKTIEKNTSSDVSPIYTMIEYSECSNINIENIESDKVGRSDVLGYMFLFTRSCDIYINNIKHGSGWATIDGNWFRDITVNNSKVISIGSHENCYDLNILNTIIEEDVTVHGGGILNIDNVVFIGINKLEAIRSRTDYACEWDGIFKLKNITTINSTHLVRVKKIDYDAGRKTFFPNIEIDKVRMFNKLDRTTYITRFDGWNGDYETNIPFIKIDNVSIETSNFHRTVALPEEINNNLLNGEMVINVSNLNIPRTSFKDDVYRGQGANFTLPKILNNNFRLKMFIDNSIANFRIDGTSNINIDCEKCNIYFIRYDLETALTENGLPLIFDFNNCKLHKFISNVGSDQKNIIHFIIRNSKFVRFREFDGDYDNIIGGGFVNNIVYSSNNIYDGLGTLSEIDNIERLIDYIDNVNWKNS